MKFFLLIDPDAVSNLLDPPSARHFRLTGTWARTGKSCPACSLSEIVPPWQIEWERGSQKADFFWNSVGYTCLIRVPGFQSMRSAGFAVTSIPVVQKKRGVVLPVENHVGFSPVNDLDLNSEASGLRLNKYCPNCGKKHYIFKRDGLQLMDSYKSDFDIFSIRQIPFSPMTYLSERGIHRLLSLGLRNWGYSLAGTFCG